MLKCIVTRIKNEIEYALAEIRPYTRTAVMAHEVALAGERQAEQAHVRIDGVIERARADHGRLDLVIPAVGELCTEVNRLQHAINRGADVTSEDIARIDNNFRMLLDFLGAEVVNVPEVKVFEDDCLVNRQPAEQFIAKKKGASRR